MCSFVERNDILLSNVSSACITEQVFQKMLGLLRIEEAYKWNLLEKSAKVKNWSPQEREIEKICNSLTSQPTPSPSHLQAWDLLLYCLPFSSCPEENARSYILWWPMPLRATWSCFISCCATTTGCARELRGLQIERKAKRIPCWLHSVSTFLWWFPGPSVKITPQGISLYFLDPQWKIRAATVSDPSKLIMVLRGKGTKAFHNLDNAELVFWTTSTG